MCYTIFFVQPIGLFGMGDFLMKSNLNKLTLLSIFKEIYTRLVLETSFAILILTTFYDKDNIIIVTITIAGVQDQ